jgi:predicted metal-dependent hydrolase
MASDEHHKINFNIKSCKGARGIRIAVNGDGSVVVTKPIRMPSILAETFVQSKIDWIYTQIQDVKKRPKKFRRKRRGIGRALLPQSKVLCPRIRKNRPFCG